MGNKFVKALKLLCGIFMIAVTPSLAAPLANSLDATPTAPAGEVESLSGDRKLSAGIEALRIEMKEKPSDATALRLGQLLLKNGANGEALLSFDEALKLNPRSVEAKVGKGIALGRRGEYARAEQLLRDALGLNPNPARVHYELGVLFERRGDFAGAVSQYKEGLKRYREGMK
jgi:Flp pilus assembly protein TadD